LPEPLSSPAGAVDAPLRFGLGAVQLSGLRWDEMIDGAKELIGVPERICDEGINSHVGPFQTGPISYLPGYHQGGRVDYSWNHPFPWSRGFGPLGPNQRP
jgi:hypothetical protein